VPDTNNTDNTALPADEDKKQEQEVLEPLPWEVGKGFLWGLPATFWLLFRHPFRAFSAPVAEKRWKPYLFAIAIGYCYWIASMALASALLLLATLILPPASIERLSHMLGYNFREGIISLPEILGNIVCTTIWSSIVSILLYCMRRIRMDLFLTARISLYASICTLPMYILPHSYVVVLPWLVFFETIGIHKTYNVRIVYACIIDVTGMVVWVLAKRYILASIIPIDVFMK